MSAVMLNGQEHGTWADATEPALLKVESVTAGYEDTVVLADVSLTVRPGAAVALLGPNGAGKTTLLKAVSGLIRPRAGRVVFRGEEIHRRAPEAIARMGLCHIPEGRGVFPSLTVEENLTLQAPKGGAAAACERAVTTFPELGSRMKQTAGSLSGGEQQMLSLARTAISDPMLIVVDEMSLGLAPIVVDRIFEALGQLAARGAAMLIVEQYVTRALAFADTVYLLNRGQIVYSGASKSLDEFEIARRYLGVETDAS